MVGEQEADVLKIHIENYLFPAVPADATAHVSNPPPSGGSGVSLEETKKTSQIRITRKKIITAGETASPVAANVSTVSTALEIVVVTSAHTIVSPFPVPKRRKLMPSLSTFQATKAARALHADGSGSSMPLTSSEIVYSAAGGQSISLADLIS
ncbi:hypothetical protein Hanom_Chr06g00503771 [Helianthus anomalus]